MGKPKTTNNLKEFETIFRETPEFKRFYEEYKPSTEDFNKIYNELRDAAVERPEIPPLNDLQIIKYKDGVHLVCFQDSYMIVSDPDKATPIPPDEVEQYHLEYLKKRTKLFYALAKSIGPLKVEGSVDNVKKEV